MPSHTPSGRAAVTAQDIQQAAETLRGHVIETDCKHSITMSDILGCETWLKFENLQFTASFKERGALNKLTALNQEERRVGVIAVSAGNHAQGVAYHASKLGIPSTIVMPEGTPQVKVENTRRFGSNVIVTGASLEEASDYAFDYFAKNGLTFVHPYDDPLVIAGQGTIAIEMLSTVPELDTLVVPIGGGGLISGMAVAAKAIKPEIRVIGVQSVLFPSMYNVIKGEDLEIRGDTLAEGIAVKEPGKITQELVAEFVDDIVLVEEGDLERAVSQLISIEKTVVEGAGAAGIAALIAYPELFKGQKVGLPLCGGNIDTRLLASVLTRDLARDGRISQLVIDLVDRPGQLAKVANVLYREGVNIVEVLHQRVFSDLPAKAALLEVVIEARDRAHRDSAIAALKAAGLTVALQENPGGSY